jgi:hypothetical protein
MANLLKVFQNEIKMIISLMQIKISHSTIFGSRPMSMRISFRHLFGRLAFALPINQLFLFAKQWICAHLNALAVHAEFNLERSGRTPESKQNFWKVIRLADKIHLHLPIGCLFLINSE